LQPVLLLEPGVVHAAALAVHDWPGVWHGVIRN
jgi:hypothetical protein